MRIVFKKETREGEKATTTTTEYTIDRRKTVEIDLVVKKMFLWEEYGGREIDISDSCDFTDLVIHPDTDDEEEDDE